MGDKRRVKNAHKYLCEKCDFYCSKKSDWERHEMTLKHKMVTEWLQNGDILAPKNATQFICICGKKYNYRQGLSRHKKQCDITEKEETAEHQETGELQEMKEFMKYLMKENTEMKSMIVKVIENGTNNTINNINTLTTHLMLTMLSSGVKHERKHNYQHDDIDSINNENKSRIVIKKSTPPLTRTLFAIRFVHFSNKSIKVYNIGYIYYQ